MATDAAPAAPEHFEISKEDGSAYYLIPPMDGYDAELVQVPLDRDGEPVWESDSDRAWDFGGGAVDWDRGIEDEETRERLIAIQERLLERMG